MKNLVKLLFVSLIIFSTGSLFAQYTSTVTPFPFVNGPEQDVAPQCIGGLVYDDGTFENGYGWNPGYGIGKFVMLFTPNSYPYTINQVCFAMTRLAGSGNWTFDIEVWTYTAGGSGTLVVSIPNQVAVNVGLWPTVTWHDFTGITTIPALTEGSYYVGISYDPVTMPAHYIGADESATTQQRPGYAYIQNAWGTIQSFFAGYKTIGVRVDGTGVQYTHDIGAGPFLSFPALFNAGIQYPIKARVKNYGTSNETGIPIKFFVNGAQLNSTTFNLNSGAVDSVSFNWTPSDPGDYTLAIVSALATDEYRANDTVKTTVHVWPAGTYQLCVGTGAAAVGWPFYTFYMDSRTDMLYLHSELGLSWGAIQIIGFNVVTATPQVMNGFNIKMQNTTNTSISGFTSTGWTTVYSGTYLVPVTGWRWIDLQTPFVYNGTNLLIEICFDNTSFTANSTVASTVASGMTYHYHTDNNTGCTITGTNSATSRPNICLLTIVGNENQNSEVPKVYSLLQNYPNPFNPSTVINFSIPKASMVNLTVYDVLGREVMILVNDVIQPGEYNVSFDASSLSSGVYFYRIVVHDPSASSGQSFTDTKKMLFVK
jgi:hypothetical protein